MIVVRCILNFDDDLYQELLSVAKKLTKEDVAFEFYDTGSKKDIKKCLSYFSKYASTKKFVLIEEEIEGRVKFKGAVYKEETNTLSDWEKLIIQKIKSPRKNEIIDLSKFDRGNKN